MIIRKCLPYILLIIGLLGPSFSLLGQQIRINEVVASNSVVQDQDGDTPDWFELHNTGNSPVALNGWTISDKLDKPDKWAFPAINIEADEYLWIWASAKDRSEIFPARTLIKQGDIVRYFTPTAPVPSQWHTLSYDDSNWNQGPTGIGYGDDDDVTVLPQGTASIYLRKRFDISAVNTVQKLLLHIDYDDAFVAYINGAEVARSNVSGTPPAFNATTGTDREATMYQGNPPELYEIENLGNLLQNGSNVLAIQVHNISENSSDLSVIPYLSALFTGPSQAGSTPPPELELQSQQLHTNFKLSASGEGLYLFGPDGTLVDSLWAGYLPANISRGLDPATNTPVYFSAPTPGLPNSGNSYSGVIQSTVEFSQSGGPVDAFTLSLSGALAGEEIRYTTDATQPTENSSLYTAPLPIASHTVVRAGIFRPDYLASPLQSQTYLVNVSHDVPILSLVAEPGDIFDQDTGIYVLGDSYDSDFPYFGANFWEDWERPVQASLHEVNEGPVYAFNAGVKIFGGYSRGNNQRSLSLFARSKYGTKSFDYPLFPHRPYSSYESFILRNSGNDWLNTNIRDAILTGLMQGADLEIQAYRSVATYLNGTYWGMYNMREKISEHYLASRHNLDPDEIDLLERRSGLIHGNNTDYLALLDVIENQDLTNSGSMQYVADRVDLNNFFLYQLTQIYVDNQDWPGNNIKYWKAKGGKWRWILFDTDFGFGVWGNENYRNNTLAFALEPNGPGWPNPSWSTLMLRKITANTGARNQFINLFADELNSRFLPDRVRIHIDTMAAKVLTETVQHYNRWGGSVSYRADQLTIMKEFASKRPAQIKQHIKSQWNLAAHHTLTIDNPNQDKGFVQVNSLTIDGRIWSGDYFQDVPVPIVAHPKPGYVFAYWSGGIFSSDAAIEVNLQTAMTLTPHFEAFIVTEQVIINEINFQSSPEFDTGDWVELHNISSETIDLSEWELRDRLNSQIFLFPAGTQMQAGAFLVVARDATQFRSLYPDINNVIGDFGFDLADVSDEVRLFQQNQVLHDVVSFQGSAPWPEGANGLGPTLELEHPILDNILPKNWGILHVLGSPGRSNLEPDTFEGNINNLKGFPNPTSQEINFTFLLQEATRIQVIVSEMNGRQVLPVLLEELPQGAHRIQVDAGSLSQGMYLVAFKADNTFSKIFKWIKTGSE